MRLLSHLLNRFIRNGELRLIAADGSMHRFGGFGPGPAVTVRLHDPRLYIKLFLNPELHAGEAYVNGTLTFEHGSDVGTFMALFAANRSGLAAHPGQVVLRHLWRTARRGTRPIARLPRPPMPATITIFRRTSIACSWTRV
jgi:cyclopropane-fatty-acyl-phospholipid synthase